MSIVKVTTVEPDDTCYSVTVGPQTEFLTALYLSAKEERILNNPKDKNAFQQVLESYIDELDKQKQHIRSLITRL